MKTIILTEEQTNKIIKTVIDEDNVSGSESMTINFGTVWNMGKWKLTQNQATVINGKLKSLFEFIKRNEGNKIVVQIESGESQITNADSEVSPPVRLERGVLGQRRGQVVAEYLKQYFNSMVGKGLTKDEVPEIPPVKVMMGKLQYEKGVTNLKDPKIAQQFQQEQFVNAVISVKSGYECIIGMEVTIGYFKGKNRTNHTCDESIFQLKMNGVPLGVVNLNNGKLDTEITKYKKGGSNAVISPYAKSRSTAKNMNPETFMKQIISQHDAVSGERSSDNIEGGSRSQKFTINSSVASSIANQSKSDRIVFSIAPLVGPNTKFNTFFDLGTHSDAPWVTIVNTVTKETQYNGEPNVKMKRGSMNETVLLVTDLCGNPINTTVQK